MKKAIFILAGLVGLGITNGCSTIPKENAYVILPMRGILLDTPGMRIEIDDEDIDGLTLNVACQIKEDDDGSIKLKNCRLVGIPYSEKTQKGGQI